MRKLTSDVFLKDVAKHKTKILLDSGIYRHVHCAQPKTGNLWFELVTWPGALTIRGDMGSWTFSRVEDMFTFFRSTRGLEINPDYWSEKILGGVFGGRDAAKQYDDELWDKHLLEMLTNYYSLEGSELEDVTNAVKEEILRCDSKYEKMTAAANFSYTLDDGRKFQFDTCELPDGKDYSYQFIWCCYAIVWGIQQYDKAEAPEHAKTA